MQFPPKNKLRPSGHGLIDSPSFHALSLLLVGGILFFLNLSGLSLTDTEETGFALQAREMVESGDWIVPRWSHRPAGTKPPLFPWTIALLSKASGEVSEWTARLPSAAAALLTLFLVYALGGILFSQRTGFLSALILATTFLLFHHARMARSDMLLTFFITLSVTLFVVGGLREGQKAGYLLGAYGAAALATLAKGPVGLILPALGGLAFLLTMRRWRAFPIWGHLLGAVLFFVLAAPWYILYAQAAGREYVEELLLRQNVIRYLSAFDHRQPLYYYVEHFSTNLLPWTFLVLPALVYAWKKRSERANLFLLLWWAAIFVFFSLSTSKRDPYILPLFPAAALLTGAFIEGGLLKDERGWGRWGRGLFQGMMVTLAFGSVALLPLAWVLDRGFFSAALLLGAIGLLTGVLSLWAARTGGYGRAVGTFLAGLLLLQVAGQWTVTPVIEARRSPASSAASLARLAGDRPLIALRFNKASVDFYGGKERRGKVYYTQDLREVVSLLDKYPEGAYVLMREKVYQEHWEEIGKIRKTLRVVHPFRYGVHRMILLESRP